MNEQHFTCIRCPFGCRLSGMQTENGWEITGNRCPKGKEYFLEESTNPQRILTCLVSVAGKEMPLSVKTTAPIPKKLLIPAAQYLQQCIFSAPISIGDVLVENLLETGVSVVATKNI